MPSSFIGSRRALLGGGGGGLYSLYDAFLDTLAAGSVNGSLSTPPDGVLLSGATPVRTVTDTNSKLSIVGGVASFATGGASHGDPGLWYPLQTRVLGKTLLVTQNYISGAASFGLDVNQNGAPNTGIVLVGTALQVRDNAVVVAVGVIATGTVYSLAIVMRSSGAYYFIKGGTFTNWTLIWISSNLATDAFPEIAAATATSVFTADNIRVPVSLYIPSCAAYDTFTRADGAIGSTETAGPDGASQVTPALAWTLQDGTIAIVSNKASLTVLGGDLLGIATVTTPSADVMIDCNLVRTLGSAGIVARYADASNYLRATTDGTNVLCEQVVAGTPTTLRTAVTTYGAGQTLRLKVVGTVGTLFYNGAAVGASFTVPSSAVANHGLYGSDLSATWDNFQVFAVGTNDSSYNEINSL